MSHLKVLYMVPYIMYSLPLLRSSVLNVRVNCAQGLNGGCHSFSAILYKINGLIPGEIST